uniref:Uncharacterized protein n=1 Tax=Ralstonia solanacearum TaxID=305 RepID=A0A0S4X210_RALSL|nr:protein of unknown function [Ralstonia solanacearum]
MPRALAAPLVFSVVRVVLHFVALPTLSAGSLADWRRAVGLFRDLRAWLEGLATACADPGGHRVPRGSVTPRNFGFH